jgi:predicted DNA-binding transcriptional regulator YafY
MRYPAGLFTGILMIFVKQGYHLIEKYGPDCYIITEDGNLKFSGGYTNREHMISWVLGFGDKARVIEPVVLACEIKKKAKNIILNYEQDI